MYSSIWSFGVITRGEIADARTALKGWSLPVDALFV
jgi:hypothetical protein